MIKLKWWMLKPNEIANTIKTRFFGLCDVKGCWRRTCCKKHRFCFHHIPMDLAVYEHGFETHYTNEK